MAVAAFVSYALLVPPGPWWLDSQELASAGVQLGVPHPSGFPLFCLLAQAASLFPFGELAFRVHLVSAASAAVAVGFAAQLAGSLVSARAQDSDAAAAVGGVAAAALLGASTIFFGHATVAEVYAPSAALLAVGLWLTLRVLGGAGRHSALALALLAGVAATGAHAELRLLLLPPAALVLFVRLRRGARHVLAAPLGFALGAVATAAYLPLRSASGHVAALDWGHPSTFSALWDHLWAARVRAAYGGEILSAVPEVLREQVRRFAHSLEASLGALALTAAVLGALWLLAARRGRAGAALLLYVAAVDLAYGAWVNPMGLVDLQNGVPFSFAIAILVGAGVAAAAGRTGPAAPFAAAVLAVVVVTPAALDAGAAKLAARASDAPRAFVEEGLNRAPPGALALVTSDSIAAGLYWLTEVEGARPDVAVLVRQHLHDVRRSADVLTAARVPATHTVDAHALLGADRTLLWEPGADDPPPGTVIAATTPLWQLGAPAPSPAATVGAARLARVFSGPAALDPSAGRAYAAALVGLARRALTDGDTPIATTLFARAITASPRHVPGWQNLAVLAARRGDTARAATLAERALDAEPHHAGALVAAARYRLALNQDTPARRHAALATRVAPARADAWALLGTLDARAGDLPSARRHLERALAIDPTNEDARINLARINLARIP